MNYPVCENAGENRVVVPGRIRVDVDIVEILGGASVEEHLPQRRERERRRRYIHKRHFPGRPGRVIRVYSRSESEKRFVVFGDRRWGTTRRRRSVGDVSGVKREDGERAETELRRGDAGEFSLDCEDDCDG